MELYTSTNLLAVLLCQTIPILTDKVYYEIQFYLIANSFSI